MKVLKKRFTSRHPQRALAPIGSIFGLGQMRWIVLKGTSGLRLSGEFLDTHKLLDMPVQ